MSELDTHGRELSNVHPNLKHREENSC